jgi:hypothetical protein
MKNRRLIVCALLAAACSSPETSSNQSTQADASQTADTPQTQDTPEASDTPQPEDTPEASDTPQPEDTPESTTCFNEKIDPLLGETDVDCGGGDCPPCVVGKKCTVDSDCVNQSCEAGTCLIGNCNDGSKNGDETYIDCGGSCPIKCEDTRPCKTEKDCKSGCCNSLELCEGDFDDDEVCNSEDECPAVPDTKTVEGSCECLPQFTGSQCDKCSNKFTGNPEICDECAPGFSGDNCDECAPAFTGDNCADDPKTPEDYGCEPHPGDPIEGTMGTCQNTVDGCILGQLDAIGAATACALGCLGAAPECSGECMAKTGLSAGCGGCFSQTLGCMFDNCIAQCATAPDSAECGDCRAEFCNADFETCSGIAVSN